MNRSKSISTLIAFLLMAAAPMIRAQKPDEPRVFLLDIKAQDRRKPVTDPVARKIDNDARRALSAKVASIVSKEATPPSGDKHDYMSQAPYFWRNPDTPTGLPYVRRDGERNPEIKKFPDHDLLDSMVEAVERMSLGYFVTGKD